MKKTGFPPLPPPGPPDASGVGQTNSVVEFPSAPPGNKVKFILLITACPLLLIVGAGALLIAGVGSLAACSADNSNFLSTSELVEQAS